MFIGHIGVALAAKKVAPKVSLGTLVIAAQFVDLLWPFFLLIGVEHVRISPGITAFTPLDFYDYPISHSLVTGVGWGIVLGFVYYRFRRSLRDAFILGACVLSHWVLDFISHRPDMPIVPGVNLYVGLGLWNSVPATIVVEAAIFGTGVLLYLRATSALDRTGTYAFWSFIVFLIAAWVANMVGGAPPSVGAIAWGGQASWLLVAWAYWADRHRTSRSLTAAPRTDEGARA